MAAVSWSGFFGDGATTTGSYSLVDGNAPRLNAIKRVVHRDQFRTWRALFDQLIGAAAGGNASATHKNVQGGLTVGADFGGLATIQTITDINRATTAGDVTNLKNVVDTVKVQPNGYPKDLSGNGGPAFTPVQ